MSPLILYLVKSAISISLLYLCYSLVLRKESIFHFNRFFLLASLFIASLLPFFQFNIFDFFTANNSAEPSYLITYQLSEIMLDEVTVNASSENNQFTTMQIISAVYVTGVAFKLLQLLVRVSSLLLFARKQKRYNSGGAVIVVTKKDIPTSSFFKFIFISQQTFNENGADTILSHERIHIVQYHSFDLVLAELIAALQWFNPFVYRLKKSIKENHEFIADHQVVASGENHLSYKLLLMEQASNNPTNILTHNFSYSLLKRRLLMINKPKRPLGATLGVLSAAIAMGLVLFACSTPEKEQIPNTTALELSDDVYTVVEVMPEYPGGFDELINYLATNIEYPREAKENGIQGKVLINFVVEPDGSISDVNVLRGIGGGCDTEAIRVVQSMPDWKPGLQDGKPVRTSFNMPIKFKLDSKVNDTIYNVVEVMPEFPGGREALLSYLSTNITYPEKAKKDKIQGRVFISFIVEKDGSIGETNVLRGIGDGCDEEALRVVNNMPSWKAGMDKNGNAVRVRYNIPIHFTLN